MSASRAEISSVAVSGPARRAAEDGVARGSATIDEALWLGLSAAAEDANAPPAEFAAAWLPLQCAMIPAIRCGVVAMGAPGTALTPLAVHPQGSDAALRLADAMEEALAAGKGVVQRDPDLPDAPIEIAYPILVAGAARGAVGLEMSASGLPGLHAAMRQLQWGTAWMREHLLRDASADAVDARARLETVLDLLAAGLDQESFKSACRTVVTRLALKLGCERVGIGFVRRGYAHVVAVSHSAEFGKQMNLVRQLGEAMDEALDQQAVLLFPPLAPDPHVTRAHAALAESHGCGAILTTPLFVKDRFVGAVTFERPADRPFTADEIATAECVASVLGAILDEKRLNDRWLAAKAADALGTQAVRLFGPGHLVRKAILVALAAAAAFSYFATGPYRIVADANVEGEVQRAVVAPYNGFIREAPVRAGDRVAEGEILATLDDRDLALQRLRWVTERQRKMYEYERALGERNRAEAKITSTEAEQAQAQINLIDEQMARAKLYAPFNGLVVSGDLSQAIGGAVQRGQLLFEVAPLDRYRVILEVDESQIGDVHAGESGELVVTSLPNEAFGFKVTKITPVAKAKEGRNLFRVEAQLDTVPPQIRPGMRGVGKINVDERRLVWIWTRSFVSWLKLWTWRWTG
ncbi:HlyD family efflux transporter periplasmic adaptor subunit [Aquabacter sp. CN5-332]|uniref:HlyD family efflux transporter periplasmic adaptor subunit n=1 Tax=Aquabacter sp. CN5-332 TaxID=3156608 RepID=UPI0032B61F58